MVDRRAQHKRPPVPINAPPPSVSYQRSSNSIVRIISRSRASAPIAAPTSAQNAAGVCRSMIARVLNVQHPSKLLSPPIGRRLCIVKVAIKWRLPNCARLSLAQSYLDFFECFLSQAAISSSDNLSRTILSVKSRMSLVRNCSVYPFNFKNTKDVAIPDRLLPSK